MLHRASARQTRNLCGTVVPGQSGHFQHGVGSGWALCKSRLTVRPVAKARSREMVPRLSCYESVNAELARRVERVHCKYDSDATPLAITARGTRHYLDRSSPNHSCLYAVLHADVSRRPAFYVFPASNIDGGRHGDFRETFVVCSKETSMSSDWTRRSGSA